MGGNNHRMMQNHCSLPVVTSNTSAKKKSTRVLFRVSDHFLPNNGIDLPEPSDLYSCDTCIGLRGDGVRVVWRLPFPPCPAWVYIYMPLSYVRIRYVASLTGFAVCTIEYALFLFCFLVHWLGPSFLPCPVIFKCGEAGRDGARIAYFLLSPSSRLSYFEPFRTCFVLWCAMLCYAMPRHPVALDSLAAAPPFVVVIWWLGGRGNGRAVQVKGPFPKFDYSPNVKKEIGMIAGGTGTFE